MCTRCCGEMASTLRSFTHTIRAGATTTIFRCCRRRRSSSAGELVAEEERTRSLGSEKNKGSVSKKSSGSSRSVSSGGSGRFRSKSPSPLSVDSSGNDKEEVAEKGQAERTKLLQDSEDNVGDFAMVERETDILRNYQKPPPPKNRARASRVPRALNTMDLSANPDVFKGLLAHDIDDMGRRQADKQLAAKATKAKAPLSSKNADKKPSIKPPSRKSKGPAPSPQTGKTSSSKKQPAKATHSKGPAPSPGGAPRKASSASAVADDTDGPVMSVHAQDEENRPEDLSPSRDLDKSTVGASIDKPPKNSLSEGLSEDASAEKSTKESSAEKNTKDPSEKKFRKDSSSNKTVKDTLADDSTKDTSPEIPSEESSAEQPVKDRSGGKSVEGTSAKKTSTDISAENSSTESSERASDASAEKPVNNSSEEETAKDTSVQSHQNNVLAETTTENSTAEKSRKESLIDKPRKDLSVEKPREDSPTEKHSEDSSAKEPLESSSAEKHSRELPPEDTSINKPLTKKLSATRSGKATPGGTSSTASEGSEERLTNPTRQDRPEIKSAKPKLLPKPSLRGSVKNKSEEEPVLSSADATSACPQRKNSKHEQDDVCSSSPGDSDGKAKNTASGADDAAGSVESDTDMTDLTVITKDSAEKSDSADKGFTTFDPANTEEDSATSSTVTGEGDAPKAKASDEATDKVNTSEPSTFEKAEEDGRVLYQTHL